MSALRQGRSLPRRIHAFLAWLDVPVAWREQEGVVFCVVSCAGESNGRKGTLTDLHVSWGLAGFFQELGFFEKGNLN